MSPPYLELCIDEDASADLEACPTRGEARYAAVTMAVLFVFGYCIPHLINSHRDALTVWHADWERVIPYWSWTIIPYATLDFLFVLAPFFCRRRQDLLLMLRRAAIVMAISAACFLAFPTRMVVTRPSPTNLFDSVLLGLLELDAPFNNLLPSLHVSLVLILAGVYMANFSGLRRWAVGGWFALVAFSTLTTWQHHVLDAAAGLLLGLACLRWVTEPESADSPAVLSILPFVPRRPLPSGRPSRRESLRRAM